ncbi:MAG TPA: KH domain-containing protein [Elusimicrobiota bacterium]|nr:KH domain-containing protein [Elusimicrobiota bacterium]
MKELALFVVKRLVDKPEAVTIDESRDGDVAVLNLNVDEADKGKVIGKQGKVIKAIRAVVGAAAAKAGVQVAVEID